MLRCIKQTHLNWNLSRNEREEAFCVKSLFFTTKMSIFSTKSKFRIEELWSVVRWIKQDQWIKIHWKQREGAFCMNCGQTDGWTDAGCRATAIPHLGPFADELKRMLCFKTCLPRLTTCYLCKIPQVLLMSLFAMATRWGDFWTWLACFSKWYSSALSSYNANLLGVFFNMLQICIISPLCLPVGL